VVRAIWAKKAVRGCALFALVALSLCPLLPPAISFASASEGPTADRSTQSARVDLRVVSNAPDPSLQELPPLPARVAEEPASKSEKPKGAKTTPAEPKDESSSEPSAKKEEVEPEKAKEPWYSVHEQGTVTTQKHDHFRSPYIGRNSLLPAEPAATIETATLYLDARLWRGADIVFNPEISGGQGFSGTSGLAGFPNGEATRVGIIEPTPYIARLFVRQVWGFEGEQEKVEDDANQIAGVRDVNRFTIIAGKLAATDNFDNNRYSHDPRTQFDNWALMYNGAWDYPANVRGYTYGFVLDFNTKFYALRYGAFAEPAIANGAEIDPHFLKAQGQILELEERYTLGDHPGRIREWAFLNHAHMGDYREALEEMPVNPDVTATRSYRFKYGYGVNLEQELTQDLGFFLKLGWNDGHTESWAFTEIDRTAAMGLVLKGRWWRRPKDEVGVGGIINGLAPDHRDYLRAGGLGFIIGDGRLNYAPEQILETYYNWQIVKGINATLAFQGVNHPAYNADRGPVAIGSLRVHFEH
jgi:high affinity Mn2+ porin